MTPAHPTPHRSTPPRSTPSSPHDAHPALPPRPRTAAPHRPRHAVPTRTRRVAAAALVAALAVCALSLSAPGGPAGAQPRHVAATAQAAPKVYGISLGDVGDQRPYLIDRKLADIQRLGFTWIRQDFSWANIQPRLGQRENLARLDLILRLAAKHHLRVLGILGYAPHWAAASGCSYAGHCAPRRTRTFASFARDMAKYFRTRVATWEIWNEENTAPFWSPHPSPRTYAALLNESYSAIRSVAPNTTVIGGGFSNAGPNAPAGIDAVSFLQGMYAAGIAHRFDGIAYHPYTYPRYPDGSWAWEQIPELHAVMARHGDGGRPIWLTEFGAPTGGSNARHVDAAAQASIARAVFHALGRMSYVHAFFWYCYEDVRSRTSTRNHYYGLVRTNGTRKPAYGVWKSILH